MLNRVSETGGLKNILSEEETRRALARVIMRALDFSLDKSHVSAALFQRDLSLNGKLADTLMKKLKADSCFGTTLSHVNRGYPGSRL